MSSIPMKLLNESMGHVVTVELNSGQTLRGKLLEMEDTGNCSIAGVTATARDGRVTHLAQVYVRGSSVRLYIVPDMLRNAPMFRRNLVRGGGKKESVLRALQLEDVAVQEMTLCNTYFSMDIGVWIDEYEEVEEWIALWGGEEADEAKAAVRCLVCLEAEDAGRMEALFDCDKVVVDGEEDGEWEAVEAHDAARLRQLIETSVAEVADAEETVREGMDLQDSYDTLVSLRAAPLDPEAKRTQAMDAIRRLL